MFSASKFDVGIGYFKFLGFFGIYGIFWGIGLIVKIWVFIKILSQWSGRKKEG